MPGFIATIGTSIKVASSKEENSPNESLTPSKTLLMINLSSFFEIYSSFIILSNLISFKKIFYSFQKILIKLHPILNQEIMKY